MSDSSRCSEVRDLIPELAAGVASGEERAEALAHLARCPACRRELDETTAVMDDLLLLGPSREPSQGFETSVLERMKPPRSRRSRRGRLLQLLAVVAAAAVIGSGVALWITAPQREIAATYERTLAVANGQYFTARDVTTESKGAVGYLFAYEGSPSWVLVTIAGAPDSGEYEMQVVTRDGETQTIDECVLSSGRGSCGGAIEVPLSDVLLVRLTKPGKPTLTARI
jgi:hypothetical protein